MPCNWQRKQRVPKWLYALQRKQRVPKWLYALQLGNYQAGQKLEIPGSRCHNPLSTE
jgi:hypothetical protein